MILTQRAILAHGQRQAGKKAIFPTTMDNTLMTEDWPTLKSVDDWAIGEAMRLRHRMSVDKAAQVAARRAPGLLLAAQALHRLTLLNSNDKTIPTFVRLEVQRSCVPLEPNDATVTKLLKWLAAAPYELTRCSTAASAIAAAAPVALVKTQDPNLPRDEALERKISSAMHQRVVRKNDRKERAAALRKSDGSSRRVCRTSPMFA